MKKIFFIINILIYSINFSQTWTTGAEIPQGFRASNVAAYKNEVTNNGYLYLISGRDFDGNISSRNQRYDVTNNTWIDMASSPTGVLSAATAILKDSIYLIGGVVTTPGSPTRKVYKYSINQNTWSQVASHPVNIYDSEAVAYQDSLIYVVGGYNTGKTRIYNSKKNSWRNATAILPNGSISWGALSVSGNKLVYVCGSSNFLSTNYFNTVRIGTIDQNNRANITWTNATPFPGETRTFFDVCPWQNGLIMTGGSTNNTFETNSNECYFYNVDADTWTQLASKPTSWLTGNSASLLIDNQWKLICASGYNNSGYLLNTEIFSSAVLKNNDFEVSNCNWQNFRINKSIITFCNELETSLEIMIHSTNGALVLVIPSTKYEIGKNEINITNDSISTGMYLFTLKSKENSVTKKIFINN